MGGLCRRREGAEHSKPVGSFTSHPHLHTRLLCSACFPVSVPLLQAQAHRTASCGWRESSVSCEDNNNRNSNSGCFDGSLLRARHQANSLLSSSSTPREGNRRLLHDRQASDSRGMPGTTGLLWVSQPQRLRICTCGKTHFREGSKGSRHMESVVHFRTTPESDGPGSLRYHRLLDETQTPQPTLHIAFRKQEQGHLGSGDVRLQLNVN